MNEAWRAWIPIYRESILRAAAEHELEPIKLAALIAQESNGGMRLVPSDGLVYNPRFLYRYEPGFWRRYMAGNPEWVAPLGAREGAALEVWKRRVSASYGICQTMYSTAVWLLGGVEFQPLEPEELMSPSLSCDLAGRFLKMCRIAGHDWRDSLAKYNTGRARDELTKYDDEVIAKEEALISGGALDLLGN